MNLRFPNPRFVRGILAGILLLGAVLRTIQYTAVDESFEMDEFALVLGIVGRDWGELLLRPLDHAQLAPFGFLLLEKALLSTAGNTEASLRFLPFLLSLGSLPLFWAVARRFLDAPSALAALTLFALSPILIMYAGMVKQYAGDVAVSLLLVAIALRAVDEALSRRTSVFLGLAGGVAILLSHASVLVGAGLGVALLAFHRRAETPVRHALLILAGWAVGAGIVTWHSLATLSSETNTYMQGGWSSTFVPGPWLGVREALWIPTKVAQMITWFVTGLYPPYPSIPEKAILATFALLSPLGWWRIIRREPPSGTILAMPILVALIASAVRFYPFTGRVSLFTGSVLLVACFAGIEQIRDLVGSRRGPLLHAAGLACMVLLGFAALARIPPPFPLGGTLAVLRDVRARWSPGDRLAVAGGPWAFRLADYYGDRLGLEGWARLETAAPDSTSEGVRRSYLRRIDTVRSAPRLWIHLNGTSECEERTILGYLDAIGHRRHSVAAHRPWGHRISAYLYELPDRRRWSAETWPLPACERGVGGDTPAGALR